MTWCGDRVQVRELEVSEGVKAEDRSELVVDTVDGPVLRKGDTLEIRGGVDSSVTSDDWGGLSSKSDLLGITLRVLKDPGDERTLMASFHIPSDSPIRDNSRLWIWATGQISDDPCGMDSAK